MLTDVGDKNTDVSRVVFHPLKKLPVRDKRSILLCRCVDDDDEDEPLDNVDFRRREKLNG